MSAAKRAVRRAGTRGQANADAIRAAAHRLVLARGVDFTTQDLVKEADVALQTLYRHFGSKDQLIVAVIADLIAGHCEQLRAQAATLDDPVDRLHLYVTETLTALTRAEQASGPRFVTSQHWRLQQLLPDAMAAAVEPFTDLIAGELEAARAAGALAPRANDAWLITELVMAVFHHHAFANTGVDVDRVSDDVWRFCLAAVGGGEIASGTAGSGGGNHAVGGAGLRIALRRPTP